MIAATTGRWQARLRSASTRTARTEAVAPEHEHQHLLTCPFCGSSAVQVVELTHAERNRLAIACGSCEAIGPPAEVSRAREALERWNRRVD